MEVRRVHCFFFLICYSHVNRKTQYENPVAAAKKNRDAYGKLSKSIKWVVNYFSTLCRKRIYFE